MNGEQALEKLLKMQFTTVLDLGSGAGEHAEKFKNCDKIVTTINLVPPADIVGDFMNHHRNYDCIWCCHVLEHQRNPGQFLEKCFNNLYNNGILAITVPPRKDEIVGGHLSIWNAGLLLYNLILAGFDCRKASVKTYGYNVSVIVQKKKAKIESLEMDFGDIERLSEFFPFNAKHGFDGNIGEINW